VDRSRRWLIGTLTGEGGQDMVEYAMISMFISVAIVLAAVAVDLTTPFGAWAATVCNQIAPGTC